MQHRRIRRTALIAALIGAVVVAAPLGAGTVAYAGVTAPVGNVGKFKQTFVENFSTTASANGQFAKTYANSWQPYPDGTGGTYYSGSQVSARNGYMDVTLDGKHGAAGTFGTLNGAWSHVGGKFSVRAKATGGDGNGAAFMLWPSSNVWSDGEIDYPEANFEGSPMLHHHSMVAGQEANSTSMSTGVTWRSWHVYSVEWIPGKSVQYLLDGKVIKTVTSNVPKTAHRYMFQVGNWGAAGHLDIDWVSTYEYTG
ncbi:beta-glucanase (GH16 family) [Curtobacterium sp. PhB142]|uniref:glycoside hydrolase family 16 protein n=1 Tax=unclassified Curtobacterium TaxID=257496 RepID=UPI00104FDB93|nr:MULTISPECIES: glycoside hydrolase family 16 protein [unclassified Curtobacterium]TCL83311.1 beta-glucanase (GH16 family) [Curtobacterium sp. PhB142]TCM00832.1 beta-glucanase (GH16 family) [Curtobacterium sp. PhB134]